MFDQLRLILWAQWRTVRNSYFRRRVGRVAVPLVMSLLWYGLWSVGAVAVAVLLAETRDPGRLSLLLSRGLMIAFLYWQLIPILMVSTGASLDLKRLLAFPIRPRQLFFLEVLLRLSTSLEMLLVLAGATAGLEANPTIRFWAPLALIPFIGMNLLVAAGLRMLLGKLLRRKHVREIGVLLIMMLAVLPQLFLLTGARSWLSAPVPALAHPCWIWSACAAALMGHGEGRAWLVLLGWVAAAYAFGRWQFGRGLRFEETSGRSRKPRRRRTVPGREIPWAAPLRLLGDPLGAMVEKELRFLGRSPRFRVVFLMGFTFGLIIWLPIAFHGAGISHGFLATNYLTLVSVYALFLLGEVSFWNSFGFDRGAAQTYFLAPVPVATVLVGKNIAAAILVAVEVTAVALACYLLRMPLTPARLAESYLVVGVLSIYMLALGNIGSIRYARPVDPRHPWRSASASRFQALLLLVYPLVCLPVALPFLARYAFQSTLAFYLALALSAGLGVVVYRVALDSSIRGIEQRREELLATLSGGAGPIST